MGQLGSFRGALVLGSLLLTLGCGTTDPKGEGEETGESESGGVTTHGDDFACEESSVAVGYDEQTSLGFSAADLMADKLTTHSSTLIFEPPAMLAGWVLEGYELTVGASHAQGEARFVESEGTAEDCVDRIEVDGTLTIESTDGAFAESFDVVFEGRSLESVSLERSLSASDISGSFDFDTMLEGASLSELSVRVSVGNDWLTGFFDGSIEVDGLGNIGYGTIGSFGQPG